MIYRVDELCFTYPSAERQVLGDVSFSLGAGEMLTLLGPNGAGKSTLLLLLLGLLKASSGSILLQGRNTASLNEREIAASVGYVPQTQQSSFAFSVQDFVVMGCAAKLGLFARPGREEIEAAREALGLLSILPLAEQPITAISGGERQKAMIARAIVAKPAAILFDEPTAHLDYPSQIRVLRLIRDLADQGFAVIMTSHNPDHALLLGGRAALLDSKGSLQAGEVDIVINEMNLQLVYGAAVRLVEIPELGRRACVFEKL